VEEDVRRMNVGGALLAAILAILVFLVGQAVLRFILEPILEQRRLIGEVAHALLFYANVGHLDSRGGPDEQRRKELDEARITLRGLAGRLRASLWTVPFYDTLARLGSVPSKEDVLDAATQFVGWSNSLYRGTHDERTSMRRKIIADRLGITKRIGVVD
jgi:hypothetical protein